MRWLSGSVKFRCVFFVGVPSALRARPRRGISFVARSSRSGSTPALSAASIAFSRATMALAAAASAFLFRSACSSAVASDPWAAAALARASSASWCRCLAAAAAVSASISLRALRIFSRRPCLCRSSLGSSLPSFLLP